MEEEAEGEGKTNVSGEALTSGEVSKSAEEENPPDWLPDGWTMEVRTTRSGTKYRYYTSPVSGYTFRSRREVLRYLSIVKVDGHVSETTSCSGDKKQKLSAQVKDSPEWLPAGWILEIKTRMSGEKAGQKYKCYFDPFTGSRFYSKGDVFRFLKSVELCNPVSKNKKCFNANATDNVLAQIEYSPDGLPHGWMKEIKFRKCKNTDKIRKDPYYIDPVGGYIFRTLKDAVHYVETGEISKYAIRPRKRSIRDVYSLEKESPPPIPLEELKSRGTAVRRCLFEGETPKNGDKVMEIDESPAKLQFPPLDHASSQSVSIYLSPDIEETERKAKKIKKVLDSATENLSEPKQTAGKAKRGRPKKKLANRGRPKKKLSDPAENLKGETKKEKPSTEILPGPAERKQLDLAGEEQLELANEKTSKISNMEIEEITYVTPEVLLIENPLQQEIEKPNIEESKLLEPLEPEDKLLEQGNEKSHLHEVKQTWRDKGIKKHGRSKTNAHKTITLPQRTSKRLAGIEPAVTGLKTDRRSRQSMSNDSCNRIQDSLPSGEQPKSMESIGEQAILGEQAVVAGKLADDKPGSPVAVPFGDSWLDPCIEFAVKTLTGDIPVLEDGNAIQNYFHQQLISVESSSTSAPVDSSKEGFEQAKVPAQLEPPEEHNLSVHDDGGPLPSESRLPSSGDVNKDHRQSAILNH